MKTTQAPKPDYDRWLISDRQPNTYIAEISELAHDANQRGGRILDPWNRPIENAQLSQTQGEEFAPIQISYMGENYTLVVLND